MWTRGNGGANLAATAAAAMSRHLCCPRRLRRLRCGCDAHRRRRWRHTRHLCRRFAERRLRGVDGTAGQLVGRPVLRRRSGKQQRRRQRRWQANRRAWGGGTVQQRRNGLSRAVAPLTRRPAVGGDGRAARRVCMMTRWTGGARRPVKRCMSVQFYIKRGYWKRRAPPRKALLRSTATSGSVHP